MNYSALAVQAQGIIAKFGKGVVFTTPGQSGGFDPDTGDVLPDVAGANILGVGVKLSYKNSELVGDTIQRGDAKLIYSGQEPAIGNYIELDGVVWRVMDVAPLQPAGVILIYTVQLRR